MTNWKTRARLILERLQIRTDRTRDTLRLWHCKLTMATHAFADGGDHCLRCDTVRTRFWGQWVILDG